MTDGQTETDANQLTLMSRLTASLLNRRLAFFAAELVLLVAGVLIALAITRMDLAERIIDKNNAVFVDDIYNGFLMRTGITSRFLAKN